MTKSYSIRDDDQPKGKIWSRGGSGDVWSKNRKVWGSIGPFKNHLNLYNPLNTYGVLNISYGFYFGTLIPRGHYFPYGGEKCVIVEVDEAANIIREYPAARWCWNNVYFPWYQNQWADRQTRIREKLGVQGEIALTMLEPVHVEAVVQTQAFEALTDDEIYDLLEGLGSAAADPLRVIRATEELVREKIVAQRSKM